MNNLRRLEEIFAHFPGIGPRQARRFVYYLLNKPPAAIREFIDLLNEVRKAVAECSSCHRFFLHSENSAVKPVNGLCPICADQSRDQSILMIVARDSDFESVERSAAYRGLYFILGGTVPILDKDPEKRIRLEALLKRIQNTPAINEIILSLNTTADGEHTAEIVAEGLHKILANRNVKITHLGRGLSTGAELEYADSETIKNAIRGRSQD